MSSGYPKQSASRPVGATGYQVLQLNNAFVSSTGFHNSTQQIRVVSQVQGWATINQTTNDTIIATSAGGVGMIITGASTYGVSGIFAGGPIPEYFTVTPGQILSFASTSVTTGALSVTEMT